MSCVAPKFSYDKDFFNVGVCISIILFISVYITLNNSSNRFWYGFRKFYWIPIHHSVREFFNSYKTCDSKKYFYFFPRNRQNRLGTCCMWNLRKIVWNVIWFSISSVKNKEEKDHGLLHMFRRLSCCIFTCNFAFQTKNFEELPIHYNVTIQIK